MTCCPLDSIPVWATGFRYATPLNSKHVGAYFGTLLSHKVWLEGKRVYGMEEALGSTAGGEPSWVQVWDTDHNGDFMICGGPTGIQLHFQTRLDRGFVQVRKI